MKVLFVAPPQHGGYFNLCYNFTELGEVATYIRHSDIVEGVRIADLCKDYEDLWKDLGKELEMKYDVVAIWNRFDNLRNVKKVAELANASNPESKIVTYGQPSSLVPMHFTRYYPVDAVLKSGPWEISLNNYFKYLSGDKSIADVTGLVLKDPKNNRVWCDTGETKTPPYAFWEFADLDMLPLKRYFEIYQSEDVTIAGFKGKKELSFSVSRGCPMTCMFCNVHKIQGRKDIRKSVDTVMKYLDDNFSKYGFDFVSVFSPIFTLDRDYAIKFSREIRKRRIEWKCVSHINYVDEELLGEMAEGGCKRIGFGLETMGLTGQKYIKKKFSPEKVAEVIDMCRKNSIVPLMFLMLGIPGETRDEFISSIMFLKEREAHVRITAFTPYYEMREDMTIDEMKRYDRTTISSRNVKGMSEAEFEQAIENIDGWLEGI